MEHNTIRLDHQVIVELIPQGSSVLDLGCGNGDLLYMLIKEKNVRGQGIEIDEQAIYKCVAKGLNVFHDDIDPGLSDYEDQSFLRILSRMFGTRLPNGLLCLLMSIFSMIKNGQFRQL